MAGEHLDPGVYTNIFQVQVPDVNLEIMIAPANKFPTLRDFRKQIADSSKKIRVYRDKDTVIGYGPDSDWCANRGFKRQNVRLHDYPKWCSRTIVEGLVDHLALKGYREWSGIGRTKLYEAQPIGQPAQGHLRLFRGYDLRVIYWRRNEQLLFGLVVDICWEIQDAGGRRLSTPEIAQYNAMAEIARLQEEYLSGNRINPEVSRLRLQNHILPFVRSNSTFALPCAENLKITLDTMPLRVVIGV